ncbi:terpenoid synthase [Trametes meyenii]|nr:terpenoid synthase [Trametes meyenii]
MPPAYYLHLPDFMSNWPWPRKIHPLYEEVTAESSAWLKSFAPFTPESQFAFDMCDLGRLAALGYPEASREHLRIGVDLMNVFFVIDEYTDVESASAVREMVEVVIDATYHPEKPRPAGESILGEMTRQLAQRLVCASTSEATAHFLNSFSAYLRSVVCQAEERCEGVSRSIDSYIKIRRENSGGRPSFSPVELRLRIPDEVFYAPSVVELQSCILDMITTINDVLSYNREQATGNDDYNLLTVVMRELSINFDDAIVWVMDYHNAVAKKFIEGLNNLPSFGSHVDAQLQEYLQGIANWPRCVDSWSFESKRYFGEQGLEYQRTRLVPLLQRREPNLELHQEQVQVHLIEKLAEPIAVA